MDEKQENLIKAVKTAVTRYGLTDFSTRNIGDIAPINVAYATSGYLKWKWL